MGGDERAIQLIAAVDLRDDSSLQRILRVITSFSD